MAPLRSAAVVDIDRDLTPPQFLDQVRWPGTPECVAQLSACPSLGNQSQTSQRRGVLPKIFLGRLLRQIFFPMPMTCKERPRYDISIHALKYTLATLIQGVASALRHQFFEHASHSFYSIHQMVQLRKLSLGERSPAFRRASDVAETKEQVSDFSQCKTELTRTLNNCQAVKRCGVVSSLPADSRGSG